MLFPAVSICNVNPLISPGATEYIKHYYETTYNLKIPNFSVLSEFFDNETIKDVTDYLLYLTYTPNFDSHVNLTRDDFGYGEAMLLELTFSGFNFIPEQAYQAYYDLLYIVW